MLWSAARAAGSDWAALESLSCSLSICLISWQKKDLLLPSTWVVKLGLGFHTSPPHSFQTSFASSSMKKETNHTAPDFPCQVSLACGFQLKLCWWYICWIFHPNVNAPTFFFFGDVMLRCDPHTHPKLPIYICTNSVLISKRTMSINNRVVFPPFLRMILRRKCLWDCLLFSLYLWGSAYFSFLSNHKHVYIARENS
jgi:hypothetical protein